MLRLLFARKGQEETHVGWGLVVGIVIVVLAILFVIWLSRQSGRSIIEMLREIV